MAKYKFHRSNRIQSNHWRIEWVDLDEGFLGGTYDETNPKDYPVLRFDIYSRQNKRHPWEPCDAGSYATCVNALTVKPKEKKALLKLILDAVIDLEWDDSVKRIGERLSYMNEGWANQKGI